VLDVHIDFKVIEECGVGVTGYLVDTGIDLDI